MQINKLLKSKKILFVKTLLFIMAVKIYDVLDYRISLALKNEATITFEKILHASFQLPNLWTDFLVSITYLYIFWIVSKLHNQLVDSKSFTLQCSAALNKIGYAFNFIAFTSFIITGVIEVWVRGGSQKFGSYFTVEVLAMMFIGVTLNLISIRTQILQKKVDSFV